ncbi:MAG: tRNA-dihydrouridine synthase family protein [Candidatus Omnitrophica bacterium]|nr:tRNA-dihydrouridine synthase family protein [Candidatus Omnitrophota bacterium]MBU1996365.1 tRNA-dihydrouridine synthase family protein [Candidatus Omnitrophota bacterium]MBU4333213.1 tRNA-dihydrouridine synthase family protein [Candidatus Omnitrophota bacterium]
MKKEQEDILYMAPLLGVTNCVYRSTYSRYFTGYDRAIAPFIASCDTKKVNQKLFRDILPDRNNFKYLLIPQILSKNANDFIVMVKAMHDLGYGYINWNLGCPFPMVRKKIRGSGLLAHPDLIRSFLDKVMPNIPSKLSVKVRLGCDDNAELLALMPIFDAYPLEEIIIHPRTGSQMYAGNVDLAVFKNCLDITKHKVVYNGDINSLETFKSLKKKFNTVSGWMIGRGGIVDPFLPEKIKGKELKSNEKKVKHIYAFHNEMFSEYSKELIGLGHILDKMKEIWSYWHKAFFQGEVIYKKICRTKIVDKYSREVSLFFEAGPKLIV